MKEDGTMLVTCDDGKQQTVNVPKVVRDNQDAWKFAFDNGRPAWYKKSSVDSKGVPQEWVYPDGTAQEGTAAKAGAPGPVGASGSTGAPGIQWDTSETTAAPAKHAQYVAPSATYAFGSNPTAKVVAGKAQAMRAALTGKATRPQALPESAKRTEANIKLFTGIVLGVAALGLIVWVVRGK